MAVLHALFDRHFIYLRREAICSAGTQKIAQEFTWEQRMDCFNLAI